MIILPAIDILGGRCVRLYKGEYGTAEQVAPDPLYTARQFELGGAEYIHMVDLDGAKDGRTVNHDLICTVAKSVNVPVEIGGGIRSIETVRYYLENGLSRVILGSAALKNPELVKESVAEFGDRIAVGIDARDGKVSISGWTEESDTDYIEFARLMEKCGVRNIIFTDIDRDGTLSGANTEMLAKLNAAVGVEITASGGVRDVMDIQRLASLGLYGAIAGKSIYSGTLSLSEAIEAGHKYHNAEDKN